jgi:hypothetical protein
VGAIQPRGQGSLVVCPWIPSLEKGCLGNRECLNTNSRVFKWPGTGVSIGNWIYWTLKYIIGLSLIHIHTLQFTIPRIKDCQFRYVFTRRCLGTVPNAADSATSGLTPLLTGYCPHNLRLKLATLGFSLLVIHGHGFLLFPRNIWGEAVA